MNLRFLLTVTISLIAFNAEAQFLKKLNEKVNNAVERKVEQKVEQKAEKTTDKVMDEVLEGNPDKKKTSSTTTESPTDADAQTYLKMAQEMQAGMLNATYEKSYTFNLKVVSEFETTEGRKKEKHEMTQFYADQSMMMISSQEPQMKIITDFKNESSVVLNDTDKSGTAMSLSFMKQIGKQGQKYVQDDEDNVPISFKKTGNSKTIAGYLCEEYIGEDATTTVRMWCSKNADFGAERFATEWGKLLGYSSFPSDWNPYGAMLRFESTDKKSKDMTTMEIKSVEKTTTVVQTSSYKFLKM